jgi:hypothetical protein
LAILRVLKNNQTWYCPTHLTRKADALAEDEAFRQRYKDTNPILRFLAFEDLDATVQEDTSALGRQTYRELYLKSRQLSGLAYRMG